MLTYLIIYFAWLIVGAVFLSGYSEAVDKVDLWKSKPTVCNLIIMLLCGPIGWVLIIMRLLLGVCATIHRLGYKAGKTVKKSIGE